MQFLQQLAAAACLCLKSNAAKGELVLHDFQVAILPPMQVAMSVVQGLHFLNYLLMQLLNLQWMTYVSFTSLCSCIQ